MTAKGPEAFRTISEAAAEVGAPPHVLRFWETKFSFIRPVRRPGGQRLYRPRDIELLSAVRRKLHDDGYSIREVQRLTRHALAAHRIEGGSPTSDTDGASGANHLDRLRAALSAAVSAKARLDSILQR